MFGVGENPVYLQRVAEREERRRLSGEAQAAEEAQRRQEIILEGLMSATPGAADVEQEDAQDAAARSGMGTDTTSSTAAKASSADQPAQRAALGSEGEEVTAPSPSGDEPKEAPSFEAEATSPSPSGATSLDEKLDQLFAAPSFGDDDDDDDLPPPPGL